MSQHVCIWCKGTPTTFSREHIIPEALGGNDEVVLSGAVCKSCNNALARLDRALIKEFELIAFLNGIKGKKGRNPTISSWAAISGTIGASGPEIWINAGPGNVDGPAKTLKPASKQNGVLNLSFEPHLGRLGFDQKFGGDINFLRALYKIGLSLIARFYGPDIASGSDYDHVRRFVLAAPHGQPMTVAMEHPFPATLANGFSQPILRVGNPFPCFEIKLLGLHFLVDMHPEQKSLRSLQGVATMTNTPFYVFPLSMFAR